MAMVSGKAVVDAVRNIVNRYVGIRNIRIADGLTLGEALNDLADTYEATELAQKMSDFGAAAGKGAVLTIRLGTELEYEMDVARPNKQVFTVGDNTFSGLVEQAIEMLKSDDAVPKKKKGKKEEPKEKTEELPL